jgi:arsenite-transporting ATPase
MRIILFTGKGGVGKTTFSAATALLSAQKGYKTLVISTDAAHSLSDSFETQLSNQPEKIGVNLYGQEINALEQIEKNWGDIKSYLLAFFSSQGIDDIEAEEMSVFPGMEELFSLMEIRRYEQSSEYDVIVVDCAPTGDTLRLLSAPEITNWYLKHIFPIQRTAARAVRPVASRVLPFPFPEDKVFGAMKKLSTRLAEMKDILSDSEKTTIRLVVNPEKMVIKEAQRAFTFFNLFGYAVDLIIVNRVIPQGIRDAYFNKWKSIQAGYLEMITESFSPIPILSVELLDQEIIGKGMLSKVAQKVYDGKDPCDLFISQKPVDIQKTENGFDIYLNLPFVHKAEIDLLKNGDELIVKVGAFKRNILLPHTLTNYAVSSAKFEHGKLKISFCK